MYPSLRGKVALITGASSGIGMTTSVLFARLGARLALTSKNEDKLLDVAEECTNQKGADKVVVVTADLTKEEGMKNVIETTIQHFGRLDILVNCVYMISFGSIEMTSLEQYDQMMSVNVRSIFGLTMYAVPYLIEQRGCIVNVSSVCGTRAFAGVLAYCMSKTAVDQMSRCMALELAPKGVRVNTVNPGVIVTDLLQSEQREKEYAEFLAKCETTHPLGRAGTPDEVASAIAFLASDASSFVTGENLHVDGGRHATCSVQTN